MKKILIMAITLTFLLGSIKYPGEAEAGAADTIMILAVIGGAVYGGYYFSQNYKVEKKSDLKI